MLASAPHCTVQFATFNSLQIPVHHQSNSLTPLLQAVHQQQAAAEQERGVPAGRATEAAQEAGADKASEAGRAAASYVPPKWAGVPEGWASLSCWTLLPSRVTKPQLLGSGL